MEFTVRKLPVTTGGIRVVMVHEHKAKQLGLRSGDRVSVSTKHSSKEFVAVLDTISNSNIIKETEIGFFQELHKHITQKNQKVLVQPKPKPSAVFAIQKKVHGERLSQKEMTDIVNSITKNELTDVEMTYFVSASFHNELTESEIVFLTQAMIQSGDRLSFGKDTIVVDKHCIGGVAANRTTTLVVPILAAAGYIMPKTSSRSITSPAGTSDTMEVLTEVSLSAKEIKAVVKKTNGCLVWGGGLDLAPADDKIIRVEHPLSLDPQGQLVASILAKKKSVGATHVLIDIPAGKGSKIEDMQKAKTLQKLFVKIGKKLDMQVLALITDGTQPIGNGIGPVLEARDILLTLQDSPLGSSQLKEKALSLSAQLLNFITKRKDGLKIATELFESQKAYKKFIQILNAQGAKITSVDMLPKAKYTYVYRAKKKGRISSIDNKSISRIAKLLGAPFDITAGVYLQVHVLDRVEKNQALYTLHSNSELKLRHVKKYIQTDDAIRIREK